MPAKKSAKSPRAKSVKKAPVAAASHPLGDVMGDYAGNSVDVVRESGGRVAMLPRAAQRLDPERFELFSELERHGFELAHLEHHVDDLARACREAGISWSLIGFALGLTGEAARLRYGSEA